MPMAVDDNAIKAEKHLESRVNELHKDLLISAKKLIEDFNQNKAGLGAHDTQIYQLLQALIEESENDQPVKKLVLRLRMSAANRTTHRNNNRYKRR